MKNKIIILTLIISFILIICLSLFGFKIGKIEICSISDIIEKNNNVKAKIEKVTTLASSTYPATVSKLEGTIDEFNIQKQKYEEISELNSDNDGVYETEKYDIGYLWTTLGKYATKNNIGLALNVKKAAGTDLYDLDFTIQGEYVDISTFITKIENDSNLLFRIYNFKLIPGKSTIDLKATFTVKDVNINGDTLTNSSKANSITNIEEKNKTNTIASTSNTVEQ